MSENSPAAVIVDSTGANAAAVKPASTPATAADPALVVAMSPGTPVTSNLSGYTYSSYSPDPASYPTTNQTPITIDAVGRLETHTAASTDEGSFRDDFSGAALATALTGTLGFTNGSLSVTGVGTNFTTSVVIGQWIKKSADAETLYAQVATVGSDTSIVLMTPYTGTTASGVAGVVSNWNQLTASGGSVTVASSLLALASGTTSGQSSYVQRLGDYLPYTLTVNASISQRIANQTAQIGFRDTWASPTKRAEVQFTGTVNTQVNFITAFGSAAGDIQTTTVTIPNSGNTSTAHFYKIDLSGNQAALSIDGIIVATHLLHLPGPYDNLNVFTGITNTAAAGSSTTLSVDAIYFYNTDRVQVDSDFSAEPSTARISDGTNAVAVKALGVSAGSTDNALVVALSPNSPVMGEGSDGRIAVGLDTLLFQDTIEGSTINGLNWGTSLLTMTAAQASGNLTLNSGAITTINTYAILNSDRQIYISPEHGLDSIFRARFVGTTNCVQELGFGLVATNAAPTDGVFFRSDATGALKGVINFNGTETTTAALPALTSSNFYGFNIYINEMLVTFEITNPDDTVFAEASLAIPATQGSVTLNAHLPVFARVYNSGSVPTTAPQIILSFVSVQQKDLGTNKDWSQQLATFNRSAIVDPSTFAQSLQLAAGAAPTASTPANTTVAYATLGGEFRINATASSENLLGVFGYQVPSPYTFVITDILMTPPVVSTAIGATITIQQWALMIQASSNNPSTATGLRIPIGQFSCAASAAVGTVMSGQPIALSPRTPIGVVYPGQYLLILVKAWSGVATGAFRGSIIINGYWE